MFLPGESQGRGAWWAAVSGVAQSRTQLKQLSSSSRLLLFSQVVLVNNMPANAGDIRDALSIPGQENPLEKDMATHSNILAWRIPWTQGSLVS